MAKTSQRNFLVKVIGIDGFFATKQGGDKTSTATKVWDGGVLTPDILSSPPDVTDVTLTRPYDRDRDPVVIAALREEVGRRRYTVTVTPTDRDLVATGAKPTVYADALLTAIREPDVNASSGDSTSYELTFACPTVTSGV